MLAQRVVEELAARAAALLRAVERGIGVAQQRRGARFFVAEGDSDAGADVMLVVAEPKRHLERRHQAGDDVERIVLAPDVLAEDDELVAADAGEGVGGTQHLAEARRDADEQRVADVVAERVVDALEVV